MKGKDGWIKIRFGDEVVTAQDSGILSRAKTSPSLKPTLTSESFVLHYQSSLPSNTDVGIGFGDVVVTSQDLCTLSRAKRSVKKYSYLPAVTSRFSGDAGQVLLKT